MELVPVPLVPTCPTKWVYKAVENLIPGRPQDCPRFKSLDFIGPRFSIIFRSLGPHMNTTLWLFESTISIEKVQNWIFDTIRNWRTRLEYEIGERRGYRNSSRLLVKSCWPKISGASIWDQTAKKSRISHRVSSGGSGSTRTVDAENKYLHSCN